MLSWMNAHIKSRQDPPRGRLESPRARQPQGLAGFWARAQDWFWVDDMPVDAVMTDNGANFCSGLFAEQLARRRIAHLRTRPYRPRLTAKPSASTAPSPRNSSTPGASDPKTNGASASNAGSVTTTATDTTPKSAARPHHAPTTSRELTPAAQISAHAMSLADSAVARRMTTVYLELVLSAPGRTESGPARAGLYARCAN